MKRDAFLDVKPALKPVCHCAAYRFPHRPSGGKCECWSWIAYEWRRDMPYPGNPKVCVSTVCGACGHGARTIKVDFGVGAYEFWGSTGVDVDICEVSECCEAGMVPNNAWRQT